MKIYYVYMLRCADGTYYTDFTSDLKRKLKIHQAGHCKNTQLRLPIELVFSTEVTVPALAIAAKRKINRWSRTKKEALINGEFSKLSQLV